MWKQTLNSLKNNIVTGIKELVVKKKLQYFLWRHSHKGAIQTKILLIVLLKRDGALPIYYFISGVRRDIEKRISELSQYVHASWLSNKKYLDSLVFLLLSYYGQIMFI